MRVLIFILLLVTNMAQAEDRVGNHGGDVVACDYPVSDTFWVLDEYETKAKITIGDKSLSYEQKVMILLERTKKHFPIRYQLYLETFNHFKTNVKFLDSISWEVEDTGPVISAPGNYYSCELKQAAYFVRTRTKKYDYYISKDIWTRLSNDQKAILVFHEILYTEAVGLGIKTSEYVREANRLILGTNYNPVIFDSCFTVPMYYLPKSQNMIIIQLLNSYSEGVALHLLNQSLYKYYTVKNFRRALVTLKERFGPGSHVSLLVDKHLEKIDGLSF